MNVEIINKVCIDRLREAIIYKYSYDRAFDFANIEKFFSKYFHHYNEQFLLSYILYLKIDILVILLRNIYLFFICNKIRARITRIDNNVLKIEIIASKIKSEIIVISRISLNSKNDKISSERKKIVPCQFTRRQYSIRLIFAMTINKSQNQSFRYIDIDIQTRECFSHKHLYVVVSRITKKCNLYIIILEANSIDVSRLIRNIQ